MKLIRVFGFLVAGLLLLNVSLRSETEPKPGVDWPSFRGIRAGGIAEGYPMPAKWNVAAREGVRWRTALEGLGTSSPIVWADRVCVSTAVSGKLDSNLKIGLYGDIASVEDNTSHTWKLICLDKKTGRVVLDRTILTSVPKIKRHTKSTHANSTLATDGTHLVLMLGSEGLHTYDMSGKLLWKKDLGLLDSGYYQVPEAQWEFGSSPVIHDGLIVIQADVQKGSFLAAFDVTTGKEMWRTARSDVPTWGSPTIHRIGTQTQILVNGWRHIGAYDFKTGREIWKLKGGGDIPVPTPVVAHGHVYITNAHGPLSPIYAIRETATGDISLAPNETSNANITWSVARGGAYMATPLVYGDILYVLGWNGVLLAHDAKSGERFYQQRLGGGTSAFTASPVAADGKLYFISEEGDVFVVKAGKTYELIATNSLDEIAMATPAISEGVIYFRTGKSLVAIGR
jgi:outer membrane protein assembly factor BamB